jgi:hypothetical protein
MMIGHTKAIIVITFGGYYCAYIFFKNEFLVIIIQWSDSDICFDGLFFAFHWEYEFKYK